MPHACITGATGFLGRHLTEQLVEAGWSITALCRTTANTDHLQHEQVHVVPGDILDPESLATAMKTRPDAVFHIAASTNQWRRKNADQTRINVTGTRNVVQASLAAGCGRFIHTSSFAIFGIQHGVITEETPSNALEKGSNYMRTKYLAEQEVMVGIEKGLDAVILNPPHIMGRYDRHNWASLYQLIALEKLPGIPPGKGTFVHAPEVARMHLAAVEAGKTGERYLLGGENVTFLELVREIARQLDKPVGNRTTPAWVLRLLGQLSEWSSYLTGREPDLTPEKVQLVTEQLTCDGRKAEQELGCTRIPLETMVTDTIDWLRQEKLLRVF